ncbi:MAG TPA: AtzH-like domain-containing protein [Acidimicrobiales bacterium]|nr:AtzH-like domain-containing protein [Acidimicrobiales bacterium]
MTGGPEAMGADVAADVVLEVGAAFTAYEAALVANDVVAMNRWFRPGPSTCRFGIADVQSGYDEIVAWRRQAAPVPPGRTLSGTSVVPLCPDVAVVTTCFSYPGRPVVGRQSQVWLRTGDGWRIASAHVSEVPAVPAG